MPTFDNWRRISPRCANSTRLRGFWAWLCPCCIFVVMWPVLFTLRGASRKSAPTTLPPIIHCTFSVSLSPLQILFWKVDDGVCASVKLSCLKIFLLRLALNERIFSRRFVLMPPSSLWKAKNILGQERWITSYTREIKCKSNAEPSLLELYWDAAFILQRKI